MSSYSFYKEAESGEAVRAEECLQQIRQYKRIVIWGAGNLGSVLGKRLMECGVEIEAYWDARYEDIKECNGLPVREPLKDVEDRDQLLAVFCITNAFVIPALYQKMESEKIQ